MSEIYACVLLSLKLFRAGLAMLAAAVLTALAKALRLFNRVTRMEQFNAWLERVNEKLQAKRQEPRIGPRRAPLPETERE